MKKRVYLVLVAAITALSLIACGQKNSEAPVGGTVQGEKDGVELPVENVTLTVWGDPANQAVLEAPFGEINAAFEKTHPNIKIDYQWSGSFDNLNVATQSDALPDLFWVQGNKSTKMAELARNGYILNLDSYQLDASRYPQACVDYATVDDSIYCNYPAFFDYATVYYNKDMFEENGVNVPTTFSEFEAVVKTFADKGITPISLGGSGEWDRFWLLQSAAPALCTDTLVAIKNHEEPDYANMEKLFDMYRRFSENNYMGKDFTATDGVGAQLTFTNGKAAMSIDGTWSNAIYRDLEFEVGAFAMPDENGVRFAQSGESNFTTFAVSSKCAYPDEAVEYLKFLNSKEAEQIMENYTGSIPIVKDIEPKDEMVKDFAAFDEVGLNIYHVLTAVADEQGKPQDALIGEIVPKLMTGDMTGAEGVARIKEEIAKSSLK